MWLADDLPEDLPTARIFIYGYDTKLINSRSQQDLADIAGKFAHLLSSIRIYPLVRLEQAGRHLS
jgi:hypothetical protein